MKSTVHALVLSSVVAWPPVASGFSSDQPLLARTVSHTLALTNTPILATATFTNRSTHAVRGFFYSEQLSPGLAVTTVGVTLNGQSITNFVLEAGQEGDVYPGYTPWRWRLESPTNFTEAHPIGAQASVQISYSISSSTQGCFSLPEFVWAGYWPNDTNACFGCSESVDQRSVWFVASTNASIVSAQPAVGGCLVALEGIPGVPYVLESSVNLQMWDPLVTNLSPFSLTDTSVVVFGGRFYRGKSAWGGP